MKPNPNESLPIQVALNEALAAHQIESSATQREQWLVYLALIEKWNKTYNLTRVSDPMLALHTHLIDSLAVAPHLPGERIADIGAGAGLPGIPLAIFFPQRHFTLVDAVAKKTRFMTHVKLTLGLSNVSVLNVRAERYQPEASFDTVVSRAFASLSDFATWTGHWIHDQGQLLALKGQYPQTEIDALPDAWQVTNEVPLNVSEVGQRHLLTLTRR